MRFELLAHAYRFQKSIRADQAVETGARERIGKKAYVRATQYPNPNFDRFYSKYQSTPGWRTYAVESGHDVMIDMPERLAAILFEA